MTMTEPKQTEGQRIADSWRIHIETLSLRKRLAAEIDAVLSAERLKAQGLVEALEQLWKSCILADQTAVGRIHLQHAERMIANALTPYASAADDKGNGNGNS